MNINVYGNNIEVTNAMRDHIETQMEKLENLEQFIGNSHIDVTVRVNKQNCVAECKIRVNKVNYFAKSVKDDMYDAIDEMAHGFRRQLRKAKEKSQNHKSSTKFFVSEDFISDEAISEYDDFNAYNDYNLLTLATCIQNIFFFK